MMLPLSVKPYPKGLFFLLLLVLFCCISGTFGYRDSNSSAYEILETFGFPAGLLPETVTDYNLEDNGKFAVYLDGSCAVDIPDAYPVKYASKISGTVNLNSLSNLSGITVKVLFVWWEIDTISVSGDDLVFKVGPATATYPILNFSENPVCEGSARIPLLMQASR